MRNTLILIALLCLTMIAAVISYGKQAKPKPQPPSVYLIIDGSQEQFVVSYWDWATWTYDLTSNLSVVTFIDPKTNQRVWLSDFKIRQLQ